MKISLHISFIAVRSNRTICSVQCLTERGPQTSVSIIGGLVEPDVVSVEQPTIRETEAFGLGKSMSSRYFIDTKVNAWDHYKKM